MIECLGPTVDITDDNITDENWQVELFARPQFPINLDYTKLPDHIHK